MWQEYKHKNFRIRIISPFITNQSLKYPNVIDFAYSQSNSKFITRMFSLRKRTFSRFLGTILDLLSVAINPAIEKSLSTSVEIGGGVRNFLERT